MEAIANRPSDKRLLGDIVRSLRWNLLWNAALASTAGAVSLFPPAWLDRALQIGVAPAGAGTAGLTDALVWVVAVAVSLSLDLGSTVLHIHSKTLLFRAMSCFSLAMAKKIISRDVIGYGANGEGDRSWAQDTIDRSRMRAIQGAFIQALGLPLFVMSCTAPWAIAFELGGGPLWLALILSILKIPVLAFACVETLTACARTLRRQL